MLVAVALCLLLGRRAAGWLPRWSSALSRAPLWLPWVIVAALFGGVGLHYAAGLQVSGDEPHYLLMAQSLWREHDLDLRDEYDGEDWPEYVPGPLRPH